MTEPPKPKEGDEICPMCRRPKSKHSPEELLTCSRKMEEFKKNTKGGAGIEWIFTNCQWNGQGSIHFVSNSSPKIELTLSRGFMKLVQGPYRFSCEND